MMRTIYCLPTRSTRIALPMGIEAHRSAARVRCCAAAAWRELDASQAQGDTRVSSPAASAGAQRLWEYAAYSCAVGTTAVLNDFAK